MRELTQQELAHVLGLSGAYISALGGGRKPAPPRMVVEQLVRALGVDAEDLWGTARAERELRLSLRVDGAPTSLRVEQPPNAAQAAVEEERVLQAVTRHHELGQVVDALSAALDDPRTHATAAMQLLVRGLAPGGLSRPVKASPPIVVTCSRSPVCTRLCRITSRPSGLRP